MSTRPGIIWKMKGVTLGKGKQQKVYVWCGELHSFFILVRHKGIGLRVKERMGVGGS